ncbi:hypothetical protein G6659_05465 [Polynucleobacter paneuropaeus]|nr:hypothetical protein G6659_05465 [Polynucleobacter paneuropaeus]
MLIELITPLVLATAPTAIVAAEPVQYNHGTQMVAMNSAKDIMSYTMNGTRTYDFQGKPNDADSD